VSADWETAVSDGPTSIPMRRDPENKSEGIRAASTLKNATEGKPLVILQVNCRNIRSKVLEFWNLIETYNPDVVIGTESWLNEEINNAEVFRGDYITFRRDRCSRGGGVFICVKNHINCREFWADEDFEMTAVEVKGRNPKYTWEVVGIYRAPNEDMRLTLLL
jgi:hypothetical protein